MATKNYVKPAYISDTAISFSFGNEISDKISGKVLSIYRAAQNQKLVGKWGILDIVLGYTELAFYLDTANAEESKITEWVNSLPENLIKASDKTASEPIVFMVKYNGADLDRVAEYCKISVREVIELHSSVVYTVAIVGFLPHFPYLLGLPASLQTPRLEAPRKSVPAGSVAIAGLQAGVYPSVSPGGWNLLGLTDHEKLKTILPGDRIVFKEIS